jgi:hypothetical protein
MGKVELEETLTWQPLGAWFALVSIVCINCWCVWSVRSVFVCGADLVERDAIRREPKNVLANRASKLTTTTRNVFAKSSNFEKLFGERN